MYGKIITWFPTRRFGFIRSEEADQEFFIHVSDIIGQKPLPKWSRVSFDIGKFGGKEKATNVRLAVPDVGSQS